MGKENVSVYDQRCEFSFFYILGYVVSILVIQISMKSVSSTLINCFAVDLDEANATSP